jgi:hypothetical protein
MAWNLAEIPQIPCNDRSGTNHAASYCTFPYVDFHSSVDTVEVIASPMVKYS